MPHAKSAKTKDPTPKIIGEYPPDHQSTDRTWYSTIDPGNGEDPITPPETNPDEEETYSCELLSDERIWKQQYRSISRDLVGPAFSIDFDRIAGGDKWNPNDSQLAFKVVEAVLRYGPHTDDHKTLASHDTWIAILFNLLRAATIGLMRTTAYTSKENMAMLWELREAFPPPKFQSSKDGKGAWYNIAILCAELAGYIPAAVEVEDTQYLYRSSYEKTAREEAEREVEEFMANWKKATILKAQSDFQSTIAEEARSGNKAFFLAKAQELGLVLVEPGEGWTAPRTLTTPGSPPNHQPAPTSPMATPRRNPRRGTREPSPTPRPRTRKTAPPEPAPVDPARDAFTALVETLTSKLDAVSSKVESSLAGVLNRVDALERQNMPPPLAPTPPVNTRRESRAARREGLTVAMDAQPNQETDARTNLAAENRPSLLPPGRRAALPQATPSLATEDDFVQVGRNGKAARSYATTAATSATSTLPKHNRIPGQANPLSAAPTLSEVTVVRHGGKLTSEEEKTFRARAPDVIARTVISAIRAAAPGHPAIPRSGRWGFHSKGNFIFTFSGQVTPEQVQQVEPYLMEPFPDGELVINHGWSRVMLKMVPVYDAYDHPAGPNELEAEVRRAVPALAKKPFAQRPKWLLGVDRIWGGYSSVTFAFSDPDRSITRDILARPVPMFGREVRAVEFIDRPPLVICNHCHLLGHQAGSQACKVRPDQVRCAQCGGAHTLEEHPAKCKNHNKHKHVGVCDCNPLCLNCRGHGHISTDPACPRRKDFYVRKKNKRTRNHGRPAATPTLPTPNTEEPQVPQGATSQREPTPLVNNGPAQDPPSEEDSVPSNPNPATIYG